MNETLRILPELRVEVEYIPVRHDPARRVSLSDLPGERVRLEEEDDTPGPLMNFVLGLGDYFTAGAIFAAFALMLMIASA